MKLGMVGLGRMGMNMALFQRFQSRNENLFKNRMPVALRREFGGHEVKDLFLNKLYILLVFLPILCVAQTVT